MEQLKFADALTNFKLLRKQFQKAVDSGAVRLEMNSFFESDDEQLYEVESPDEIKDVIQELGSNYINPCNSSCCLVGYSAISGVPQLQPTDDDIFWSKYSDRVFTNNYSDFRSDREVDDSIFEFVFGGWHINSSDAAFERLDKIISVMENIKKDKLTEKQKWVELYDECSILVFKIKHCDFYSKEYE